MKKYPLLISFVMALLIAGCAYITDAPDASERERLTAKMVKLSSVVDRYFAELPEEPTDSGDALLENAIRHDRGLLAPEFDPYLLKVRYQKAYAVLLLCSKDGSRVIMEDAGCSARLDRQVSRDVPCEFTLVVKGSCKVEGADPQ
jgi:hypothetical protein